MTGKLSAEDFNRMLLDPDVPDSVIATYIKPREGTLGSFDPQFEADPDRVELAERAENAMKIGNWVCRQRRRARFRNRVARGEDLPVIVTEGDSWMQFPFLIEEVVDQLDPHYLIWSCDAAGDTARNMIFDNPEYMGALKEQADHVTAFVFSAAGNDVIGEDAQGNPVLEKLLFSPSADRRTAAQLVNRAALDDVLDQLRTGYMTVVRTVRSDPRFARLPILIHGYDYALPFKAGAADRRKPIYAASDKWLGQPMQARGIAEAKLRRDIIRLLIDALYDMLQEVADSDPHVHLVNVRGTLTKVGDWADEIHGTSDGFRRVAAKFHQVLQQVIVPRPAVAGGAEAGGMAPPGGKVDIDTGQLNVMTRAIETVDPGLMGIGDVKTFTDGFRETREAIARRAEIVIDNDDSLPFRFLLKGAEVGRAVCKVLCEGESFTGAVGEWYGTGFLVGPNLLLTNYHVINSRAVAAGAKAVFDYHEDAPGKMSPTGVFTLDPDRLFICSTFEELDYCFVWINDAPHDTYGTIPIWRGSFMAGPRSTANIVHHPDGKPKRTSLKQNEVVDLGLNDVLIHYATDTEPGSSGAPVFTDEWRLFALHHAASRKLPPDLLDRINGQLDVSRRDVDTLNEGIKTAAIAIDIDRRARSGADQAAARQVQANLAGTDSKTGFFGTLGRDGTGTGFEAVVNTYRGAPGDIDVAFWNVEWFNRRYEEKADEVARIIADLNLDIWAFEETSPEATAFLVAKLQEEFGMAFDWAASEPDAPGGRQTTTVIWNRRTVAGRRLDWPGHVHDLLKLRSDDPDAQRFEAVEGKIFDRYPGLFRFEALNLAPGQPAFDFNLVPVHLKARAEGAKRRRMASAVLAEAVQMTEGSAVAEEDWVIGGDFNAELATGEFARLQGAGFRAMSAADEKGGAITYLGNGFRSLIDSIFLSPGLQPRAGADDFMIVAPDRKDSGFIERVSDHRPVMIRLSIGEVAHLGEAPRVPVSDEALHGDAMLDAFVAEARRDPAGVLAELARRLADA
ncbi:trypsin-like peptidase domain-containing protein [Pseudooceanicola sp. LIPI14-2-Ac024]|uniref:trypsin-like peptidase domain-containing protein n=1 Tax=Pseudooceanicola sp. LIPI14-2-Ac024 TaxID=3344875 RepID=UPI0035D1029F